jgi:hypothetical protein
VRANVADGLMSASYYADWWTDRIAEHTTLAQQTASRDARLKKSFRSAEASASAEEDGAGSVEAALDRLTEAERWKLERYLEGGSGGGERHGSSDRSGSPARLAETEFWEDEAAAVDMQGGGDGSNDGGPPSTQRREPTAQYIGRRLLSSDEEADGDLEGGDEEFGLRGARIGGGEGGGGNSGRAMPGEASAPVSPASSAGSYGAPDKSQEGQPARSSMEWIPGGLWMASMLPDISTAITAMAKLKDVVSPRGSSHSALVSPPVLPVHRADVAPARSSWLE